MLGILQLQTVNGRPVFTQKSFFSQTWLLLLLTYGEIQLFTMNSPLMSGRKVMLNLLFSAIAEAFTHVVGRCLAEALVIYTQKCRGSRYFNAHEEVRITLHIWCVCAFLCVHACVHVCVCVCVCWWSDYTDAESTSNRTLTQSTFKGLTNRPC